MLLGRIWSLGQDSGPFNDMVCKFYIFFGVVKTNDAIHSGYRGYH